jgi:DNA-binding transcriptional MerR regulator
VAETPAGIPDRAFFKPSEVCEIAQVQPYVLRSWESEFPALGVARGPGSARVYRRADVEQVLRIKQLLFDEGLTLAGARRRIEGEPAAQMPPLEESIGDEVRKRLTGVRRGLQSLLELLSVSGKDARIESQPASGPAVRRPQEDPVADTDSNQPTLFNAAASISSDGKADSAANRRRRSKGARRARPADETSNG